jgi:hypothetical protein
MGCGQALIPCGLNESYSYDSFGNRTIQASESNNAPTPGCQPYSTSDSYSASLLYFTAANAVTGGGIPNTNAITGGATEDQNAAVHAWPAIPSISAFWVAIPDLE